MKTTTLFTITAMATTLLAGGALAQTNGTYLLTSSNTVSPGSPTTTIEIWAAWDAPANLTQFGGSNYDMTAGDGVFSNPTNILQGPSSSAGVANGNVITGGVNGMLWFPWPPWFPPDNPILLASYTWTATGFTPRTVDLFTSNTTNFIIAYVSSGQTIELFPDEFTPGSGVITVVPAPAVWFVVAVPLAAGTRRRRT